jgi:hypothetical protein
MKANDVKVGEVYQTKVGVRTVEVRIVRENAKGGFDATSVASGKPIRIKDAARLKAAKAGAADAADSQVADQADDAVDAPAPEVTVVTKKSKTPKQRTAKAPKGKKASKPTAEKAPGRMSCLDAAEAVLKANGGAMTCKAIVEEMKTEGLWTTDAPTPGATLSSAFLREMKKGAASRFAKTGRGLFALSA